MRILFSKPVVVSGDRSYENDVSKAVDRIASFQTGRAILDLIRAHGYVIVSPYLGGDFNAATLNEPEYVGFRGIRAEIYFTPSTFEAYTVFYGVKMPNVSAIIYARALLFHRN